MLTQRFSHGRQRPWCPACEEPFFQDPKVATAVIVEGPEGLLLVQRKNDPYQGLWTLPAGFVDADEDPRNAAIRECIEETGLRVAIDSLFDIYYGKDHPRGADFVLFYHATLLGGELVAGDDAANAAWFNRGQLPPLAFPSTNYILSNL